MVPKRYIRKIWIGFNPRKEVVMASETATREMIRAETLKTVPSKVYFSEFSVINDDRLILFFFSLCIFKIVTTQIHIQQAEILSMMV